MLNRDTQAELSSCDFSSSGSTFQGFVLCCRIWFGVWIWLWAPMISGCIFETYLPRLTILTDHHL